MIRCAIYPRKSKANDNSQSMEQQIADCTRYIEEHFRENEITVYDGDYALTAGKKIERRKDFQRMMKDVRSGNINLVVIMRYDRIARNMYDFCNLYHDMEQYGCNLVSVSQQIDTTTPYGRNFMYQMAAMAELEWALTSERYKDMHRYKINHGLAYTGSLPHFGFKIERVEGYKRVVHDKEEETRAIFEHLLLTKNKGGTARWVRETYDPKFTAKMLQSMIDSDLYIGKVRDNQYFCEPYFDQEYMDNVRKLNYIKHAPSGTTYLFTGLIKCPLCGRSLNACQVTKRGKQYIYYRCQATSKGKHKHYAVSEHGVEGTLINNINLYLDSYLAKVSTISVDEKKKKVKSIEELEQTMKRIDHLFEIGRINIDEYDKKISSLQREIDGLQNEIVEKKVAASDVIFDNWKELYDELTQKNKMLFWHGIISEIVVDANGDIVGVKFN